MDIGAGCGRHTANRIHERLRDEHGLTGGITIVTDCVREKKRRNHVHILEMNGDSYRLGQSRARKAEAST